MRALTLETNGFRNLKPQTLDLNNDVTLIVGDNGHGKSSIIEAIWIFSCAKSFRGASDAEMIAFGKEEAALRFACDCEGVRRSMLINLRRGKRKEIFIGAEKLGKAAELIGNFVTVLFEPDSLSFIKGAPEKRRRGMNISLCQCSRGYTTALAEFNRLLDSRAALIKSGNAGYGEGAAALQVWDEGMAQRGARLCVARRKYVDELALAAAPIMREISSGKEELTLEYKSDISSVDEESAYKEITEGLSRVRERDLETGATGFGPHRDEIEIMINGVSARKFGSTGQKRSALVSLKLAEGEVLHERLGVRPVFLLDDVLSELDAPRREFIIGSIKESQVIITDCSEAAALRGAAVCRVTDGYAEFI